MSLFRCWCKKGVPIIKDDYNELSVQEKKTFHEVTMSFFFFFFLGLYRCEFLKLVIVEREYYRECLINEWYQIVLIIYNIVVNSRPGVIIVEKLVAEESVWNAFNCISRIARKCSREINYETILRPSWWLDTVSCVGKFCDV